MKTEYYDGTKLLSLKDLNGNTPEIYICTTNRTGGKTTYFNRLCVNKFLKNDEKFCLLYRFNYELDDIADKFFKDIGQLFFPEYSMYSKKKAKGTYHELFIGKSILDPNYYRSCGYALSLNSADQIKKYSHLFSDTSRMLFDEFQSETGHYCTNEVDKLISIHTSIARGNGQQYRYVPIYMISNPVSMINPYYVSLGITNRLLENTHFLRGNGFVLEQGYVDTASKAQQSSAFNQAFANSNYIPYSTQSVYLNDNKAFIETPTGHNQYICTLKYNDSNYAIRIYPEIGIAYCDDKPDISFPTRIAVTTSDHEINYIMLRQAQFLISNLRFYFERGAFRFKNQLCKDALLKAISY